MASAECSLKSVGAAMTHSAKMHASRRFKRFILGVLVVVSSNDFVARWVEGAVR